MARRSSASPTGVLLDLGLVLAALLGAVVLLWRVASAALGLELVEFATGSMTPAHPRGSLAVAQEVPLRDVAVGDVVTVERGSGHLPITHRVVSVAVHGDAAVLRLKGDANSVPDPETYRVSAVHRVVTGLPPALEGLRAVDDPLVGGTAALVAAGAIGWAIWPQRRRRPEAVDAARETVGA